MLGMRGQHENLQGGVLDLDLFDGEINTVSRRRTTAMFVTLSHASPATSKPLASRRTWRNPSRTTAWSSASKTFITSITPVAGRTETSPAMSSQTRRCRVDESM